MSRTPTKFTALYYSHSYIFWFLQFCFVSFVKNLKFSTDALRKMNIWQEFNSCEKSLASLSMYAGMTNPWRLFLSVISGRCKVFSRYQYFGVKYCSHIPCRKPWFFRLSWRCLWRLFIVFLGLIPCNMICSIDTEVSETLHLISLILLRKNKPNSVKY